MTKPTTEAREVTATHQRAFIIRLRERRCFEDHHLTTPQQRGLPVARLRPTGIIGANTDIAGQSQAQPLSYAAGRVEQPARLSNEVTKY
jgi:hypothetical protein